MTFEQALMLRQGDCVQSKRDKSWGKVAEASTSQVVVRWTGGLCDTFFMTEAAELLETSQSLGEQERSRR